MRRWARLLSLLAVAAAGCSDNQPPTAVADHVSIAEDRAINIPVLANDFDPDGDPLELTWVRVAEGHSATVAGRVIAFQPAADFHGTVGLTYGVSDGDQITTGTAEVEVTGVNDAPTALNTEVSTHHGTPLEVTLTGTDPDGDALTFEVVEPPAHGTLSGDAPALTYTPAAGFVGTDTVRFRGRDASAASEAVVTIDVTNDAPIVPAATVHTREDRWVKVYLKARDADGDDLTSFAVATPPQHGALTGTPPALTYTPNADFNGTDSFTVTASDGVETSDPGLITVEVEAVNDRPVADPGPTVRGKEDTEILVPVSGHDLEGDALTFQEVEPPRHGALVGLPAGGTFRYQPELNFNGTDSFTFRALDGHDASEPQAATIVVTPLNDAPWVASFTATVLEDQATLIRGFGSDPDGDRVTATVTQPAHGEVTGTWPDFVYTPARDYVGSDSFTYTLSDGTLTSAAATVSITVTPVNDAPVAAAATISTNEDAPVAITLAGSDVDGNTLTYSIVTAPAHGALSGTGGGLTYTPARDYNGSDQLTFRVSDGTLASTAVVTIAIQPVNDAPSARNDVVVTAVDTATTLTPVDNDTDPDGDDLSVGSFSTPSSGAIDRQGDTLIYTPAAGFVGTVAVTYRARDAVGATSEATIYLGVGQFPAGVPFGAIARGDREQPLDLSRDGRFIVFTSSAALVPADTNGAMDVYLYDRLEDELERISVSSAGAEANAASTAPRVSADGRRVAFESTATNLVASDDNGVADVFVRDRDAGTTIRASVSRTGGSATGASVQPDISDDGNLVAFSSRAFDLIGDDANATYDVFVRDLAAGTTTRASVSTSGGEADQPSTNPRLSGDGRVVVFVSAGTNLVTGDSNARTDVFARTLPTGTTERVSVTSTGGQGTGPAEAASVSSDGRFVLFYSGGGLGDGTDDSGLYIRDRQSGTLTAPGVNLSQAELSGDGRYIAGTNYFSYLSVYDRYTGTARSYGWVSSNSDRYYVRTALSADAAYVGFTSSLPLINGESTGWKIYVAPAR